LPGDNVVIEKAVVITNKYGLHARPAWQFAELATKFVSSISVLRGSRAANAKSIMDILTLGAEPGTELLIRADGGDAAQAVDALAQLLASNIDEE
jgi:phosphotransferase system HPr (HPr) family protein